MSDDLQLVWHGADGSVWDLRAGPVRLDIEVGVTGLGMLPIEHHSQELPASDGRRWTGWRGLPREIRIPVLMPTGPAWANTDRAWWASLRPGTTGRLEVTAPNGPVRWVDARLDGDDDWALTIAPKLFGAYIVALTADDPWWRSDVQVVDWTAAGGSAERVSFFGEPRPSGRRAGPPFVVAGGRSAAVVVTQVGDAPAWPTWVLTGPLSGVSITVDGVVTGLPDVPAGRSLTVDAAPASRSARWSTGANAAGEVSVTGLLTPVPAGGSQRVAVQFTGSGTVSMRLAPRHYRAW